MKQAFETIKQLVAETNRNKSLCRTLDRQIDEAVYELYRLTPEEIAIVEGKYS